MGDFRAGQWFMVILFYFFFYSILIFAIFTVQVQIFGASHTATFTDPGFQTLQNYITYGGKCSPPGDMARYNLGTLYCSELDVNSVPEICNNVSGCAWQNETEFFGFYTRPAYCSGSVNSTFYNISFLSRYCNAQGLQNEALCGIFRCSWTNSSELYTQSINLLKPISGYSVFWETARFITGFKSDLGFKSQIFTSIWAFFFSYIEFLMLVYSIWKMLPFT